ncbi:hypothetical protein ACSBR2_019742 [Camellia fascicularis]
MKIGYGDPEERMNRYSPWKRKRPEHHGSYLTTPHTIGQKIDQFVNANMDLDIDTKRTSLKASASVVSLISVTGRYVSHYSVILGCFYVLFNICQQLMLEHLQSSISPYQICVKHWLNLIWYAPIPFRQI